MSAGNTRVIDDDEPLVATPAASPTCCFAATLAAGGTPAISPAARPRSHRPWPLVLRRV